MIRPSTIVLVALTALIMAAYGVAAGIRLAGDDLMAEVTQARGGHLDTSRTELGKRISAPLSSDLRRDDLEGLTLRGRTLSYRADRIDEVAGVASLVGLLLALLTAPVSHGRLSGKPDRPAASTTSIGST